MSSLSGCQSESDSNLSQPTKRLKTSNNNCLNLSANNSHSNQTSNHNSINSHQMVSNLISKTFQFLTHF
jgi:hypothetical protein